jgi:anthranilate phosphoribosyltransferase
VHTLRKIISDQSIDDIEFHEFLDQVFSDKNQKLSVVALITALSSKPPRLSDILSFVDYVESDTPKSTLNIDGKIINIVGTGGGISTFNISTTAAFLAAATGTKVLKSGSFAYNSRSGSLDLLRELGIPLEQSIEGVESMLDELNIGFVGAHLYPTRLRRLAATILPLSLKDIGGFVNLIGPLLCPFHVHGQICGVRNRSLIPIFQTALLARGIKNSITVWGEEGLDEFSAVGKSYYRFTASDLTDTVFDPQTHDICHANISELSGGTCAENAEITRSILKYESRSEAACDTVIINSAFMLLLGGTVDSIEDGMSLARDTLRNGDGYQLLQHVREFSLDHIKMG